MPMSAREPSRIERYKSVLSEHADRICHANPMVPINVEKVCQDFNLRFLYKNISRYRAYLAKNDSSGRSAP
jgi:hypothetical protein